MGRGREVAGGETGGDGGAPAVEGAGVGEAEERAVVGEDELDPARGGGHGRRGVDPEGGAVAEGAGGVGADGDP
ncbi:hypothetical protein AWI43_02025 [Streptomyces sp. WAC04657]|nr:hypothetical protein AWI43_02025 [Streptomyces sp. WAC04657]